MQNYVRALMWFNLAAVEEADKSAVKNKGTFAAMMTAPQITEAKKPAREWEARNSKNSD